MSLLIRDDDETIASTLSGVSTSYNESFGMIIAPQALAGTSESFNESFGTIAELMAGTQPIIMVIG